MKTGDKVMYQFKGKQFWKRGQIVGYPAEGLIEIRRMNDLPEESFTGSEFTVSVDTVELKEERPSDAQLTPSTT
jgi:hypothetical protein